MLGKESKLTHRTMLIKEYKLTHIKMLSKEYIYIIDLASVELQLMMSDCSIIFMVEHSFTK